MSILHIVCNFQKDWMINKKKGPKSGVFWGPSKMWAKMVCSKMWGNLWLGVYGQIGGSNRDLGGLKKWRNPGKLILWGNSKRGFKGWPKLSLELYGQIGVS